MSGPIVRTGTTPKFWENFDRAFGGGDAVGKKTAKKTDETSEKKKSKKSGKKKA